MQVTDVAGLRVFGRNIWTVEGPDVRDMGIWFTTRMTIVKLSDGSLWVDSPVSVSSETLRQITAWGPVRYLVAGTPRHVWRLEAWHQMFPEAELWAARPTPVTLKKGPLEFTGILADTPHSGWADDIDQVAFKGNPLIEEIFFFHQESRTVILDDLIQNHPLEKGRPLRNALLRLTGIAYPDGGVPVDIRLSFIHRNRARRSLQKLLSWDFDNLIIAHGPCIRKDARPFVEHAFRWLKH
jgi:hypothetical protein